MKESARRAGRLVLGVLFLLLGIAGLALPVLQGVLFLFIGVLLLAPDVPLFRRLLRHLEARFPALARRLRRTRWWPHDEDEGP